MTKLGKLLTSVIDGGTINRAKDPIGYVGRTRDLEKVSAREAFAVHGGVLEVSGLQLAVCRALGDGLVGGYGRSVRVARMGLN
jgi:hypothetical protein